MRRQGRQPRRRKPTGKTVKIGDPSRRVAVTLPTTLREFERRVAKLFGVSSSFTLWLDPGSKGRTPGRAHVLIETEADYARIAHDDVLVFAVDGHSVDMKDICRISTSQNDFRPLPYAKARPVNLAVARGRTDAKFFGESSHRRDFVAPPLGYSRQELAKKQGESLPEGRRFQGTTTYGDAFVAHPIERNRALKTKESRHEPPPFTHISSYSMDYAGNHGAFVPSKPALPPNNNGSVGAKAHEPMLSSYMADYHEHPFLQAQKPPSPQAFVEPLPFSGISTYQRDFVEKNLDPARQVYLEPKK